MQKHSRPVNHFGYITTSQKLGTEGGVDGRSRGRILADDTRGTSNIDGGIGSGAQTADGEQRERWEADDLGGHNGALAMTPRDSRNGYPEGRG